MPRGSWSNCSPRLTVQGRCSGAWVRVDLGACALPPEQIVRPLFQAPLFSLAPFRIAPHLVAVAFREGALRTFIPLGATLLLDGGKGAVAVLLARHFAGETAAMLAALGAFLGHLYPVWLGFRGGKGVATFLGTLIALHWPLGLIACAIWLLTALISRISSLSALLAAALSPVFAWGLGQPDLIAVSLFMAVLILVRHRANIARLLDGSEPRIGKKG